MQRRAAVAINVEAHDVHFAACIAEEGCKTSRDAEEGFLASMAGLRSVSVRYDQEEMLRIRRDVGLPKVLEVVVVRRRPTSVHLGGDPATWAEPIVEVRAGCGDEAVLRRKYDLFAEPELLPQ